MKKWLKSTIALGAIAIVLAGCSTGKSATDGTDSSGGKASSGVEQKIAVSLPAQLSTLDTTQTTDKVTFTVVQHIFEGLYRLDEDSQTVPGLAESVDISEDGKIYTFHLRDGIKWSDGTAITAEDFLFSWKRLVNPETMGPNAYWLDNVVNSLDIREGKADVDTIGLKALDEKTFEVTLLNPQPSFLSVVSIGWLAPQNEAYVTEKDSAYATSSENMIYSGPFVLEDWTPASDTWTLKPNPEYYDADKVKLATVEGSTIKEDNTGINLFQSGELDFTKITGQYVQQFKDDEALVSLQEVANRFLDFNKKATEALGNVHFRKAVALAIDKESLVNNVLSDGSATLNGLIPAQLYANAETGEDFRAYSGEYNVFDLEAAKKEWEQATAELGDSIELTLLVDDSDNGKKVSEYIQNQLETNLPGLKIDITPQPANNVNQARADKKYELSLSGWTAGSNDMNSYFNLYRTGSSYNYGEYDNSEYSKLVEKAITVDANDENKTFEDYKAAEKILLEDDAAQVPIYQSAANYLVNPNVKDIVYHSYGDYFYLREAYVAE
ncbi:peptide ABC transporter substrate-binding protein [Enterococcus saccharolyticus]|uniref:peptide ABC transporter substrate-binding protein n=1 Tax=Enterococcus saccharolyticus TaxID=41997 RepID=UPI0039E06A80